MFKAKCYLREIVCAGKIEVENGLRRSFGASSAWNHGTGAISAAWNGNWQGAVENMEGLPQIGAQFRSLRLLTESAQLAGRGEWDAWDRTFEQAMLPNPLFGGAYADVRQSVQFGSMLYQGRYADAARSQGVYAVGFVLPWLGQPGEIIDEQLVRPNIEDPELIRAVNRGQAFGENAQLAVSILGAVVGLAAPGGAGGRIVGGRVRPMPNGGVMVPGGQRPPILGPGVPGALNRIPPQIRNLPQRAGIQNIRDPQNRNRAGQPGRNNPLENMIRQANRAVKRLDAQLKVLARRMRQLLEDAQANAARLNALAEQGRLLAQAANGWQNWLRFLKQLLP